MRTRLLSAISASILLLTAGAGSVAAAQEIDSVWTIKGGSYAGQTVRINRSLAARSSSRFWHFSSISGKKRLVGWNPSRLPANVAFRPGVFSSSDSVAFWQILREMESDIGMTLFQPVALAAGEDPDDVIVVDTKAMSSSEGVTWVTWGAGGTVYDARVFLRSTQTSHNPRVVAHEMMHALGFGHTSAWASIMNGYAGFTSRLTVDDVAYAQAAFQARAAHEREDMWARLALAVERGPQVRDEDLTTFMPPPRR
jgi:hypothetical protein